jgi:hypothetical protein
LVELVVQAFNSASLLERAAAQATVEQARLGLLIVPLGHQGNVPTSSSCTPGTPPDRSSPKASSGRTGRDVSMLAQPVAIVPAWQSSSGPGRSGARRSSPIGSEKGGETVITAQVVSLGSSEEPFCAGVSSPHERNARQRRAAT